MVPALRVALSQLAEGLDRAKPDFPEQQGTPQQTSDLDCRFGAGQLPSSWEPALKLKSLSLSTHTHTHTHTHTRTHPHWFCVSGEPGLMYTL